MELVSETLYKSILQKNRYIIDKLKEICYQKSGVKVEGNSFYDHNNMVIENGSLLPKQMNLFTLGRTATNVMEIGFNAGHSCLLFLLANSTSKITLFDICEHAYTRPCYEYLQSIFPNRISLIEGDSTITVPDYYSKNAHTKFDLVHIDGCHIPTIAKKDIENSLITTSDILVLDDTNLPQLNSLFDSLIKENCFEEVFLYETVKYQHRIARRVDMI